MHKDTTPTVQLIPASVLGYIVSGDNCLELMRSIARATALERAYKETLAELEEIRAGRRQKSTLEFLDDLARRVGLDRNWRETYEVAMAKQREHGRTRPLAELPPDLYVSRPDTLGFMRWARHHSRGGRTRTERYMDRRGNAENPELQSSNDVRTAAWANLGPFNTPIYPGRVTNEDMLRRERSERRCVCGASLADKRVDSIYCSDRCRKRDVRANGPRSV